MNKSTWSFILVFALGVSAPVLRAQEDKESKPKPPIRFSPDMIDKTVDPCTNFYAYACGKWSVQNPIPPDRSGWGRFNELQERGEYIVRDILEKAAVERPGRTANEQKIGDYYATCMDESAIEKAGTKPLDAELQSISALRSKKDLTSEIVRLHRQGADVLFGFDSGPDSKNASLIIAQLDQGGLGLPDRDYYFKDDPKSVELREKYVAHVQKMFQLLGEALDKAASEAKVVMEIETGLAKNALDTTTRRDPQKIYHKMSDKELVGLNSTFDWSGYFEGIKAPKFDSLNVVEPEFIKGMQSVLEAHSLDEWKIYLRWHLVHDSVTMLPSAFVNENFEFFGKTLQGTKQLRPRWKRCVGYATGDLGEAIGQIYVQQNFPADSKARMLALVAAIEKALGEDIQSLPWMGDDRRS